MKKQCGTRVNKCYDAAGMEEGKDITTALVFDHLQGE